MSSPARAADLAVAPDDDGGRHAAGRHRRPRGRRGARLRRRRGHHRPGCGRQPASSATSPWWASPGGRSPSASSRSPTRCRCRPPTGVSRPELVEVLDLAARGLLRPTITTVPLEEAVRGLPPVGGGVGAGPPGDRPLEPRADRVRAWVVGRPGPVDGGPLEAVERPTPEPGPGQVRVRVSVCGVCRTDLHLAEGDLAPRHPGTVPGPRGGRPGRPAGPRVRGAWPRGSGSASRGSPAPAGCAASASPAGRTSASAPSFTGWDVDGGYAEYAVVDERYAYRLPDGIGDLEAAPLLCAGIIGYRALRRAELPAGGRLGIYGFGGSAHLTAQVALAEGATVHVMTRSDAARRLALELGRGQCPGGRRPAARAARRRHPLRPRRAPSSRRHSRRSSGAAPWPIAGIHLSDIPVLDYQRAPLRGADAPQRHGQHPQRRPGVPGRRRRHRHPGVGGALSPRPGRPGTGRPGPRPGRRCRGPGGGGWVSPERPPATDPVLRAALGYNDVTE